MLDDIFKRFVIDQRWSDNPLAAHIRPFAMQLIESGYAKNTIQSKLRHLSRTCPYQRDVLVSGGRARVTSVGDRPANRHAGGSCMISAGLQSLLQSFFTSATASEPRHHSGIS
jgi:hypothetical protein